MCKKLQTCEKLILPKLYKYLRISFSLFKYIQVYFWLKMLAKNFSYQKYLIKSYKYLLLRTPVSQYLYLLVELGWAQARARHACSGFYFINKKPEPARAWFLGHACSPDPEPANQARPRSQMSEPDPALSFGSISARTLVAVPASKEEHWAAGRDVAAGKGSGA
jgi:hypothetical protein